VTKGAQHSLSPSSLKSRYLPNVVAVNPSL